MKEKFNSIPEALQKQIIIRVGASGLSLLLVVVVIAMYRDVYLSLAFVLFFLFSEPAAFSCFGMQQKEDI